jgi:hypothetical protein
MTLSIFLLLPFELMWVHDGSLWDRLKVAIWHSTKGVPEVYLKLLSYVWPAAKSYHDYFKFDYFMVLGWYSTGLAYVITGALGAIVWFILRSQFLGEAAEEDKGSIEQK